MARTCAGQLLVATPAIDSGHFKRAVILVLHHESAGAIGVVLNRPSELAGTELLPRWADLLSQPDMIFDGGPVEKNGFIGLASTDADPPETAALVQSQPHVATIDLEADPAEVEPHVDHLRLFRGHAGWGPLQLDREIDTGSWFVVDVMPQDPWSNNPADLYESVLARQRGRLAWFALAPVDVSLN